MKFLRLSLACLLVSLLSSVGWAKKYDGLKVSDYKKLKIIVENIDKNKAGVTNELVERAVKLRLMGNEIKPDSETSRPSYLYVQVAILEDGNAYNVNISFRRYAYTLPVEVRSMTGVVFAPWQGVYGGLGVCGQDSSYVIDHVNELLDGFLLDYLESNIE